LRDCRAFALKTLDRMLREAWSRKRGFLHRIGGGAALDGSLDDQVFGVIALLDAYEATLQERYFSAARRTMDVAIEEYGDLAEGGFFDRSSAAPPLGGLDVRRKPFQDSPTPGGNSIAAIALTRLYAFTNDAKYQEWAGKTLEAFAGIAPQYGMFAATYGLAATLYAHHPLRSSSPARRRIPRRLCSKRRQIRSSVTARQCCACCRASRLHLCRLRFAKPCRTCPGNKPWRWSAQAALASRQLPIRTV
jgi:uncharacterized protein YyaL (SSP411 family)